MLIFHNKVMNVYVNIRNLVNTQPMCRNLNLGLATKARGCKLRAKKKTQESNHMLLGVQRV